VVDIAGTGYGATFAITAVLMKHNRLHALHEARNGEQMVVRLRQLY